MADSDQPVAALLRLDGRGAVVTGGGRGIGRAIAHRLAEAGATVMVADLDETSAASVAEEISGRWHVSALHCVVDVADEDSVAAVGRAMDEAGHLLHVWVNNAGVYPAADFADTGPSMWDRTMAVNLRGAYLGARTAASRLSQRSDRGRVIVNVSSVSGLRGRARLSAYTASKHGVTGLTRALAAELGADGIRVLGVAPSVVDTPGMQLRRENADGKERRELEEFEQRLADSVPLRRIGQPDDVARAVLWGACDISEFITGVVLPVDGGLTAT